jgi:hypothetical protein
MPDLLNFASTQKTNLLLLGDSGAGKTGSMASLVQAGYNLRVLDFDNGIETLAGVLLDPKSPYSQPRPDQIIYEPITDKMRNQNGKLVPRQAKAWQRAVGLLENWKTDTHDLGSITTWGPQDILVIDSLTNAGNCAMNFVLAMNARLGQQPHQSDWYQGQQLLEQLLQTLYDEAVKCNVIVCCHITYIGEEGRPDKGYPASLGKALSPKIGRYFNHMIMVRTVGKDHRIITGSTNLVELKTTIPYRVKPEYPISTGLADYFAAIRENPSSTTKEPAIAPRP